MVSNWRSRRLPSVRRIYFVFFLGFSNSSSFCFRLTNERWPKMKKKTYKLNFRKCTTVISYAFVWVSKFFGRWNVADGERSVNRLIQANEISVPIIPLALISIQHIFISAKMSQVTVQESVVTMFAAAIWRDIIWHKQRHVDVGLLYHHQSTTLSLYSLVVFMLTSTYEVNWQWSLHIAGFTQSCRNVCMWWWWCNDLWGKNLEKRHVCRRRSKADHRQRKSERN